ncbi:unnamed protein product [Rhodiola kirilowii]
MYTTELFCEDLVREILLNLPVKTLIRFKQVSRTWLYIITSHDFAKRHYYRSVANSQSPAGSKNPKSFFLVRFVECPDRRFITSLSLTNDLQECTIHENIFSPYLENMCNCCYCFSPPLASVGLGLYIVKFRCISAIALWNPATREIKVLPPSPFYEFGKHFGCFSFGQAEIKDNTNTFSYKVGFIIYKPADWPYFKLVLYDSSNNSWKALSCDLGYYRGCYADGINLKRKVHLLSVTEKLDAAYIITFDYNSEVIGRMEVPAIPQISGRYYKFQDSFLTLYDDRFLCLVVFWKSVEDQPYRFLVPGQERLETTFFDVWVMREYGVTESWIKERTIGPVRDNLIIQNYGKSTGGVVFFEMHDKGNRIYLSSCASSSAITNNLLVKSDRQEFMFVLERMESLVSINGTSDETQTQKLGTELTLHQLDTSFKSG